ncbi:Ubiquitin-like superfamily protein [Perilla frutescens var. hirtella]|uniref:Ubiquitin-like superfamily protein n=1 Tax=Perilla frutescens var. hirtella TaxID=608512 RepID=A0AAD4JPG2_PERFH|nr:Ubiquitin-like superfamily protein [Perilla frutescens var. hirtella]
MDLIFQPSSDSPFCIEIGYFDSVLEIKEKIQKYQGIPISKQTLIFNGNILNDDLNVHCSDILDRSRIQIVVTSDASNNPIKIDNDFPPPPKLRLILKMPASKLVAVEMDVKDTIQRLKEKIHELEGTPIGRLVIHANGNDLADHKTMLDCELSENSDVTVGFRPSPAMNASSRPSPGNMGGMTMKLRVVVQYGAEKIPVEVSAADNVGELRKKLQKMKVNLPQEGYFFIYKQNVMDDDRSFRWHHVAQGDTIEIFSGSVSGGS